MFRKSAAVLILSLVSISALKSNSAFAEEINPCDQIGAVDIDEKRVGTPIRGSDYDPAAVIVACKAALEKDPDNPRFHFQLGVALMGSSPVDQKKVLEHLKRSAVSGYKAAFVVMVEILEEAQKSQN